MYKNSYAVHEHMYKNICKCLCTAYIIPSAPTYIYVCVCICGDCVYVYIVGEQRVVEVGAVYSGGNMW